MNILIIGGTGTISKGIAEAALEANHHVTIVNRGTATFRNPKGCEVITADINNIPDFEKRLGDNSYDIIVDPLTMNLAQMKTRIAFFSRHCKKYVFISSVCAIGNGEGMINEDSPKHPEWSYGVAKLECEEYLKSNPYDLEYTILRPSITYGDIRIPIPVACRRNPYTVLERIIHDKPLVCFTLSEEQDHMHKLMDVLDFGKYAVSLLEKPVSSNNDYIICSDQAYSWSEAYDYLYAKLGKSKNLYQVNLDAFRIINPSLYDDLLYDKAASNVLYEKEKCKRDSELELEETPLEKGIGSLVDYLVTFYREIPLEEEYNLMTDYILLHYAHRDDKLVQYLNGLSESYRAKVDKYYTCKMKEYKNEKSFLRRSLRYVKRNVFKMIGR